VAVYTGPVQDLVDELGKLPGIGPKSAQRIAFHLLKLPRDDANRLASAITEAKARVSWCERCFNVASSSLCEICADDRRDASVICVVEEPREAVPVRAQDPLVSCTGFHAHAGVVEPGGHGRCRWT
jgi:recombination protein RecR